MAQAIVEGNDRELEGLAHLHRERDRRVTKGIGIAGPPTQEQTPQAQNKEEASEETDHAKILEDGYRGLDERENLLDTRERDLDQSQRELERREKQVQEREQKLEPLVGFWAMMSKIDERAGKADPKRRSLQEQTATLLKNYLKHNWRSVVKGVGGQGSEGAKALAKEIRNAANALDDGKLTTSERKDLLEKADRLEQKDKK